MKFRCKKNIDAVNKDVENINITTDKITKRFETISNVNIKNKQYLEGEISNEKRRTKDIRYIQ